MRDDADLAIWCPFFSDVCVAVDLRLGNQQMADRYSALCARPNRVVGRSGDGWPVSDQKGLVVLCTNSQIERIALIGKRP